MEISSALAMLEQESGELDAVLADLDPEKWSLQTPSPGWSIADQVAHLHWTDLVSVQTATKDPAFDALVKEVAAGDSSDFIDTEARKIAAQPAEVLLAEWRDGRTRLSDALAAADPAEKIAWFGPPMRPMTMITARIMETWAHGLDVFDTLGLAKPAGPALAAVARIGDRTRGFSFVSNGLDAPREEVRVELSLPDGQIEFGPAEAANRVTGSAWGFAAVVTQRRHLDDVDLTAVGPVSEQWMSIAQAFAGPPTKGPSAGERATGTEN
ncbi:TIGR03084 family metal-binding protein [Brevibacterium sp. JSBI002]|uniref:TIGR03084 family metal-binding protein n=1 Tax=Brevibacterium sp. JSBI002 TaxID=2886045 RepID=UPI0022306D85|nr:TIGR03084 family metal-binding protein [Brevibacterium sp. JSBI002]UZD62715.1 TIGR03084 family metal-binding protein [Brevibacterium sp. JSBI002]